MASSKHEGQPARGLWKFIGEVEHTPKYRVKWSWNGDKHPYWSPLSSDLFYVLWCGKAEAERSPIRVTPEKVGTKSFFLLPFEYLTNRGEYS